MKKFIRITGILGAAGLVMSAVFKINHLMGAPTLLLIGTVSTGVFILTYTIDKLRGRS
ncbi:MAG: hypothetical protein ACPG86_06490 [Schleiferiaceae bacterium]